MERSKGLRDVFFGRFLERRGKCGRLAASGGPEPPEWLCNMFSSKKKAATDQNLHIDIRPAAIQPCDLPNDEPHVKSSDHWTPMVEICMEGVLG